MKISVKKIALILIDSIIILATLFYYTIICNNPSESINQSQTQIYILSLLGVAIFIYILASTSILENKALSLINSFLLFYFLFNFGHCALWALNIHPQGELGSTTLYTLGIPTISTIIKTQLAAITSMTGIHIGYIMSSKKPLLNKTILKKDNSENKINKVLVKVNIVLLAISTIAMAITIIQSIYISHNYGYRSLYYGEYANQNITIITHISKLFIPSIIGILIFSNYDKKYRKIVYSIFAIYVLGWLLCGDRGSWIFPLIVLIVFHNSYYKRISKKKAIIYLVAGLLSLTVLNAIVEVRNTGITGQSIAQAMDLSKQPLVTEVAEMGKSMRVNATIIQYNESISYPYGNTIINSIICAITERIATIFNEQYVNLSTWFSKDYLKISYGAGFTFIAEILLNYNFYVLPIAAIMLGIIAAKLFTANKKTNSKKIVLSGIGFLCIISACRGTMQNMTKSFIYSFVIYYLLITIIENRYQRKVLSSSTTKLSKPRR